jgi:nitronate monooxygenase
VAGCDLGYMGTRFIATTESRADDEYRAMLLVANLDDVVLTSAVTGIPLNALSPSLNGVPTDASHPEVTGRRFDEARLHQDSRVRPAGHTVGSVRAVLPVAELVAQVRAEYRSAQNRSLALALGSLSEESPTPQSRR